MLATVVLGITMWKKLQLVYCPSKLNEWCHSHASSPHAINLCGDTFRIFFSCRDSVNRSSITSIDYDIITGKIVDASPRRLVYAGSAGLFDDCGCFLGDVIRVGKQLFLYYQGWSLSFVAPQKNFIGLAVSDDNGESFHKYSIVPVIDRTEQDPYSLNAPAVLYRNGKFQMWYGSNRTWGKDNTLNIVVRTATSPDGKKWDLSNAVCLEGRSPSEYSFAVSTVFYDNNLYKMFYSYRGLGYRIGYAESCDGERWNRMDFRMDIDVSPEGWDSEMIEYPFVFRHKSETYMLYCGNGYGKSGFGLAKFVDTGGGNLQ